MDSFKPLLTILVIYAVLAAIALFNNYQPEEEVIDITELSNTPTKERNGLVQTKDRFGNIKTEINYVDGIKQGESRIYHKNGKVMLKMNYVDGKREGTSEKYYEVGSLYALTPYENDQLNGIRKTYYRNGQLKAEIPYAHNLPGLGLKTYFIDGQQKDLPQIQIEKQQIGDSAVYLFSMNKVRLIRFYFGKLVDDQYLKTSPSLINLLPTKDGTHFYYGVDRGTQPHTVNVICECKSPEGYPYISKKEVEISL